MLDLHHHPEQWGIKPILFQIGDFAFPAYSFFVLSGLLCGLAVFCFYARRKKSLNENSFYVVSAGIVGGILGAKLPIWIVYFPQIVKQFPDVSVLLSGRTIVGGLIGGTLAVLLVAVF